MPKITATDRAELMRFDALASMIAPVFMQREPATGKMVSVTDEGDEYAEIAVGTREDGRYIVAPTDAGVWELEDTRFGDVETFDTLWSALQRVCKTDQIAA